MRVIRDKDDAAWSFGFLWSKERGYKHTITFLFGRSEVTFEFGRGDGYDY